MFLHFDSHAYISQAYEAVFPALSSAILEPSCGPAMTGCGAAVEQALFRKIAAALPGMDSFSTGKQEDLVDVNLGDKSAAKGSAAASQCQC